MKLFFLKLSLINLHMKLFFLKLSLIGSIDHGTILLTNQQVVLMAGVQILLH